MLSSLSIHLKHTHTQLQICNTRTRSNVDTAPAGNIYTFFIKKNGMLNCSPVYAVCLVCWVIHPDFRELTGTN
jgi:hypothetical protein